VRVEKLQMKMEIPPRFLRCYHCKQPAIFIEMSVCDDPQFALPLYPEDDSNAFAGALRRVFKTNMEVPVCENHSSKELVS
jgi:hypothetical protein